MKPFCLFTGLAIVLAGQAHAEASQAITCPTSHDGSSLQLLLDAPSDGQNLFISDATGKTVAYATSLTSYVGRPNTRLTGITQYYAKADGVDGHFSIQYNARGGIVQVQAEVTTAGQQQTFYQCTAQ